jgi:ABC-type multidrug transport system fused ATPase/permease subunit
MKTPDPVRHPDRISSYWKAQWGLVIAITLSGIVFNASMSAGPILQGRLIDAIVSKNPTDALLLQAGLFAGVILLIQVIRFIKRFTVRIFANRTTAVMRLFIYNNIMNRDIALLSDENTGDLMTRSVADVDICVEGMRKVTTEIFDTGVLMISYLVSLLVYDWKITLAACIFVPAAMALAERLKTVIAKYSKEARSQSSLVAGSTYENIDHIALLRVNGLEEKTRQAYYHELEDLETKSVRASILENSMQPVYNVIASIGIVAVLYLGGINVIDGIWTVGMFSTYVILFVALTTKAGKGAKLFNSFQKAVVSWQRIKPYLTEYRTKTSEDRGAQSWGPLIVEDLAFHYPGREELVVQRIGFCAKPGEMVGVTGPVACGKSSLGTALQGLYPYMGSIRLDGVELRDFNKTELASRISYTGHQPQLLSDTIYNNITLGRDGDVSGVLRDVCFDWDLLSMPLGVQTPVGSGGVRLSGGQQARIALARALYGHNHLMILDDPFSAVDMKTEAAILRNLRAHYPDCIIILISHRLSVFPEMDQVIVLHGDRRAEYGTHASLAATSASYASICLLQTGGDGNEA